jgi:hypothetical protein
VLVRDHSSMNCGRSAGTVENPASPRISAPPLDWARFIATTPDRGNELPKFRDTGGAWRAAITLPQEVHSPIAKAVFDELVERGLAVRRLGAMTADCPGPG